MQNTLGALNNHLFAQLERLGDEDLTGDKLVEEISRAKAVTSVAQQIIANGELVVEVAKVFENSDKLNADLKKPKMLEG